MKIHNPLTGVQASVEDEEGAGLVASGGWAEGDTPDDWRAPEPEYTATTEPPKTAAKKSTSKSSSSSGGDGDPGTGNQ